ARLASRTAPGRARGSEQDFIQRVTGDGAGRVAGGLGGGAVYSVLPLARQGCDAPLVVDAKVVVHAAARAEVRVSCRFEGVRIDANAREQLLPRCGVVDLPLFGGIAHSIYAGLRGRRQRVFYVRHALMLKPDLGLRSAVQCKVHSPDLSRKRISG